MPQKPRRPERTLCAADVDLDVVPVVEGVQDVRRADGVGRPEVAERLLGEHDTPAEVFVGPVAFDDGDPMRYILLLRQQREVEVRRAAAEADDVHGALAAATLLRRE